MSPDDEPSVDQRVLRGRRNREAVLDAAIELMEEGLHTPTADEVADRAGVARRSVYHHFEDLDGLSAAVADRHFARFADLIHPISSDGPFEERLSTFVGQRTAITELGLPVHRATRAASLDSPAVAERVAMGHRFLREEALQVFSTELRRAPAWRCEAVDQVSSIDGWVRLRVNQRLSPLRARRVFEHTLRAILTGSN